ncbi:glutaredoxin family protein [Oribacterium sp. WCC10]|uniref:glutaredoxin family protein n=1 Tax=Oribacterium sp. WCC10 TaxID=1855343 RepID=UPI0008E4FB67|nr:glutaredoxin domain-containing protein [Oribacterium sp. WCC10]SFG73630.1 Glutaredoxin [Oribacterium sp. WCC10]
MERELKLLTTYNCAKCKQVKQALKLAGVNYIECPADDKSGIDLVVKYRVMTAPTLFIPEADDEYICITNFDEIMDYINDMF